MQKKFGRYADYADARIEDILNPNQLAAAGKCRITQLLSVYLHNDGNRHWTSHPLPNYAQLSIINGIVPADIDGRRVLVLAGNLYPLRAQMGPLDAGMGMVLAIDSSGALNPLSYRLTGLNIPGDTRCLVGLKGKKYQFLVAAGYGDSVQVLRR
jgi:hypothetical protein